MKTVVVLSFGLLRVSQCHVSVTRSDSQGLNACGKFIAAREGETLIVIYNPCSSSVSGRRDKLRVTNHITAMEY